MSEIALTVSVLALVAVVGLWIGNVKIRGVGFGIGGVLFGGIIVGHFVDQAGVALSSPMLYFIQEFGLILFVYTIGIQVGPGFFASLRATPASPSSLSRRSAPSMVIPPCADSFPYYIVLHRPPGWQASFREERVDKLNVSA